MSNTALAPRAPASSALSLWTDADVAHVRATVAPQATDAEFKLLIYMANKYRLDPLLKQIWCVKYGTKPAQIFAGRDGFLAIAHRSGLFDGLETTVRIEQVPMTIAVSGGNGTNTPFTREYQYVATTHAYVRGAAHPVTVEVWEDEYSTGRDLWSKKPRTMITKVAECQALRKAFDISGLYDPDELTAPAVNTITTVDVGTGEIRAVPARAQVVTLPSAESGNAAAAAEEAHPATAAQVAAIRALAPQAGIQADEVASSLRLTDLAELSEAKADRVITRLQEKARERQRPAGEREVDALTRQLGWSEVEILSLFQSYGANRASQLAPADLQAVLVDLRAQVAALADEGAEGGA